MPVLWTRFYLTWLLSLMFLAESLSAAEPFCWPHPAGPEFNRINRELNYSPAWNRTRYQQLTVENPQPIITTEESDRPELWRIEGLSGVRAPLVLNNRLYITDAEIQPTADFVQEQTEALSRDNRPESVRWFIVCWYVRGRDPEARFRYEIPEPATSLQSEPELIADPSWRLLYCLTPRGNLYHLDSDSGDLLWRKSLSTELHAEQVQGVATPLQFENLLIISCLTSENHSAEHSHQLLAMDRRNGQIFWKLPAQINIQHFPLAAPILAVFEQQVCVVCQREPGRVEILQARTGRKIDSLQLARPDSICAEILYVEGKLAILSQSIPSQTSLDDSQWQLQLYSAPTAAEENDFEKRLQPTWVHDFKQQHVTSLLTEKYLLAATATGELLCWNLAGATVLTQTEKLSTTGEHHLLGLKREVLVTSAAGCWEVFELQTDQSVARDSGWQRVYAENFGQPIRSVPVLSRQSYYVRTPQEVFCIGSYDQTKIISDLLPDFSDQPRPQQEVPAQMLITPGFETLPAGFQLAFRCLVYSAQGNYLQQVDFTELQAEWTGPGEFDPQSGQYKTPQQLEKLAEGTLLVKWKDLSATAAIRIVP